MSDGTKYYIIGIAGVDIRDDLESAKERAQQEADDYPTLLEDCGRATVEVIEGRVVHEAVSRPSAER